MVSGQSGMQKRRCEVAIAGKAVLIGQPQRFGGLARLVLQFLVFDLRKVDEFFVVPEIHVPQFRDGDRGQGARRQRPRTGGRENRSGKTDVKSSSHPASNAVLPAKKEKQCGPAIRSTFSLLAKLVEQAAGTTVGIGDEDAAKAFGAGLVDGLFDAGRDLVRRVVPDGGKTGEVDMDRACLPRGQQGFRGRWRRNL